MAETDQHNKVRTERTRTPSTRIVLAEEHRHGNYGHSHADGGHPHRHDYKTRRIIFTKDDVARQEERQNERG